MAVKVLVPTTLQQFTQNQATLECSCTNILELFDLLVENCPDIKTRLYNQKGEVNRFLNFYVNSEDIRFLEGTETVLKDGDEVSIVPAIAGG